MIPDYFDEHTYQEFLHYLKTLADPTYKKFHGRLIESDNLYGIRTPMLKEIAHILAKGDYQGFIKYNTKEVYEEKVLYGLVLGYIKVDFSTRLSMLKEFIPCIDNWAINDIVCANSKDFKKNLDEGFPFIVECIQSKNPWEIRFGLVLLLDFYINETYIDQIFIICDEIKCDEYYVKMAIAWLISICYIKYKEKTIKYLKYTELDDWTYNKALQKMIESKRVSDKEKVQLKGLKR